LAKGLTNVLIDARRPFSQMFFGLVIKIDGLPLIKPSGSQNCQILAQIPDGLDGCDSAPFSLVITGVRASLLIQTTSWC